MRNCSPLGQRYDMKTIEDPRSIWKLLKIQVVPVMISANFATYQNFVRRNFIPTNSSVPNFLHQNFCCNRHRRQLLKRAPNPAILNIRHLLVSFLSRSYFIIFKQKSFFIGFHIRPRSVIVDSLHDTV